MRAPSPPELYRPRLTYPVIAYGAMLDRPAMLYPEREALSFKDVSLTFRELDGLVKAFANALGGSASVGVTPCACS
jgi:acyl-CoA synthetase (AMP-forming)/AMP-acid ligase II